MRVKRSEFRVESSRFRRCGFEVLGFLGLGYRVMIPYWRIKWTRKWTARRKLGYVRVMYSFLGRDYSPQYMVILCAPFDV